jgi:hypothetical protein
LKGRLALHNNQAPLGYPIRYSVGQIEYDATRHASIADLLAEAEAAMYINKRLRQRGRVTLPGTMHGAVGAAPAGFSMPAQGIRGIIRQSPPARASFF